MCAVPLSLSLVYSHSLHTRSPYVCRSVCSTIVLFLFFNSFCLLIFFLRIYSFLTLLILILPLEQAVHVCFTFYFNNKTSNSTENAVSRQEKKKPLDEK